MKSITRKLLSVLRDWPRATTAMPRKPLFLIVLLGAALRLTWSCLSFAPPFENPQETMSKMYVRSAYLIASGVGYYQVMPSSPAKNYLEEFVIQPSLVGKGLPSPEKIRVPSDGLYAETLHPPGASILTAGIMKVTGLHGWHALQLAGLVFDLMGIVLIWHIAARLCPSSAWVPMVSACLYAAAPPLLAGVAAARDIAFGSPLTLLALYAYLRYFDCRRKRWFLISACATGAASYFRPDAMLFTAFLGFAHLGEFLREPSYGHLLRCLTRPFAAVCIALLLLLPWAIRNHEVADRWIFTSTAAGCTLVSGLGSYPNPWGFGRSDLDRHREAKEAGYWGGFDPAADKYFRDKFFAAVKEHPLAYGRILLSRLTMSLAPPYSWGLRLRGDKSWGEMRASGESPLSSAGYLLRSYWPQLISSIFALIGMAGIVAIYRSAADRALVWLALLLPYLYVVITHVFTHMVPYYLMPAIGSQIIGAAFLFTHHRRTT